MPSSEPGALVRPADVERWLDELGLVPLARADRDGVTSWDLRLDGRRRFDLPITVILDPSLALICWVHFAPPIGDAFRKSFRKLLRWNDEFPFVKFSLAEDDRPVLASELALRTADRDELGLAIARSLLIADQLLEESAGWLWIGGRIPDRSDRVSRGAELIARYADRLAELIGEPTSAVSDAAASDAAASDAAASAADVVPVTPS
ncbi:MAG TPA: YbjN domain-containing protein [Candidatus Limnocylindrales bacterium]|nr:YbjN domain-containing protein [Candidatus Limnocylindrales bacterium]